MIIKTISINSIFCIFKKVYAHFNSFCPKSSRIANLIFTYLKISFFNN